MVGDLADESRFKRLNGALAACLAGRGDRYLTVSRFEDHGWTPHVEEDMGIIEMRRPDVPELYVWVADDDGSCRVWSEDVGTQDAFDILNELAEEVMNQGGKIQILAPHFFPQDSYVLAILRG